MFPPLTEAGGGSGERKGLFGDVPPNVEFLARQIMISFPL